MITAGPGLKEDQFAAAFAAFRAFCAFLSDFNTELNVGLSFGTSSQHCLTTWMYSAGKPEFSGI